MNIRFEIPQDIEEQVRTNGADLNREARESYLFELYRQDRIPHSQLRETLAVTFHEAGRLMKERGVGHDISLEAF
jgi:hypothetical protein